MQCCGRFLCTECSRKGHAHREGLIQKLRQLDKNGGGCSNCASQEERDLAKQIYEAQGCQNCRAQPPKSEKEDFQRELKLAKKGHATSQLHVGLAYLDRDSVQGVSANPVEGAKWLKKSADQGHPLAMNMYGERLEEGLGVAMNLSEAMKWYQKAVDISNYPRALDNIALMYLDGKGVPENPKEAARYFKLSADQGYSKSQYNLACMYRDGACGIDIDNEKAIGYFIAAAEQGKVEAMHNAGILIVEIAQKSNEGGDIGLVGQCPWPRAMKWFRKAVDEGFWESAEQVLQIEQYYSTACANCGKGPSGQGLLRCTRCKLLQYCSKTCQKAHWKKGHKKDCCKQN